jgi:ferric-dicitrate binding protein FerR (iron transport regulator)
MNTPDHPSLLARYLDGEILDAREMERLRQDWLQSSAELDAAVDQIVLDRLLRHQSVDAGAAAFAGEVTARLNRAGGTADQLHQKVVRRLARRHWWPLLGTAAAALLMITLWWRQAHPAAGAAVASITGSTSALLADGTSPVLNQLLRRGHRVRLQSGFTAIQFQQGAEVILEGAADLEITGPNRATLHHGSAVARVPDQAHGFTIDGPGGRVVDLGTEFAVRAASTGMEVHVLEGKVEAHPDGAAMVPLEQNHALHLSPTGSSAIPPLPEDFLTSLPPLHTAPPPWLHWSFDENSGTTAAARGHGLGMGRPAANGQLTSLPGGSGLPTWTPGVRGSALAFQGHDDYVQTGFPGLSGAAPRTVACWVQMPADSEPDNGYALISWGAHQQPGDTWQLSINPDQEDGPLGRLRLGTHFGEVIGTTDLRDGQWHHVAAVLYHGRPANTATHVLLYVDSRLEPATCKTVRTINTDTTSAEAQRVAFGKNSAVRSTFDPRPVPHTFRGLIDEVTLCGAALSEMEMRHLMTTGVIASP